jgi:hypothetical protein
MRLIEYRSSQKQDVFRVCWRIFGRAMGIAVRTVMYIMLLMAALVGLAIALPIAIVLGTIVGLGQLIAEERRIRMIVADARSVHHSSYTRKNTESDTDRRFH